ncbi:hypothetical protein ASPTUDRAFT_59538 [Aspergillus tubingensis CBS 134.48]|uniref:Uncharacterized protein n=1 Tax=Aspergillus tubingensis (strain CBS 134.48) TaxID=767770 RepID=A0A1L9MQY9_ASPTC|nr:hypothetical protein ASPTUDRAFT_59538 [Aspergillus tubingensis CBS 134.48]
MALKIWSAVMRGPTTSWMNNKFPKHTVSKQKTRLSVSRVRGRDIGWFHGSLPSVPGDIQMLRHGVRILLRGLSKACG